MEPTSAPNFPEALDIHPSSNEYHEKHTAAVMSRQRDAIERFGIAGRVWEAAYLLTRYFGTDSYGPPSDREVVEYDPPWLPCSATNNDVNTCAVLDDLEEPSSKIILELGSGMGVVGFAAVTSLHRHMKHRNNSGGSASTKRGIGSAQVVLTDLPEVCMLLKENIAMQVGQWRELGLEGIEFESPDGVDQREVGIQWMERAETTATQQVEQRVKQRLPVLLKVRSLSWGDESHVQALSTELRRFYQTQGEGERARLTIICSDLVYFPHLLAPLLRSLIQLTSPGFLPAASAHAAVIISYRVRSYEKESPFWRAFGAWFSFEPVLTRQSGNGDDWKRVGWDESALSFIFTAKRRPETLQWDCPIDDQELLYGSKGDDTFETLLMLCNDTA